MVCPDAGRHAGGKGGSATGRPGWRRCFSAGKERKERTAPAKPAPSRPRPEKDLGRPGRAKREAGCAPARACETDQVGIRRGTRHRGLRSTTGSADVTTAYGSSCSCHHERDPTSLPGRPAHPVHARACECGPHADIAVHARIAETAQGPLRLRAGAGRSSRALRYSVPLFARGECGHPL